MRAPTDLLLERHKSYRQAHERYLRASQARQSAQTRLQELEGELRAAEARDRVALGDALVDGCRPPTSEAEKLREALEEAKRQSEALSYAEQRCASELDKLPKQHKQDWVRRAEGDLATASGKYRKAISQLTEARDAVADLATLISYLTFEGVATQPIGDGVRLGVDAAGANQIVALGPILAALQREVDEVVERTRLDPNRPMPEPRFELMQRV